MQAGRVVSPVLVGREELARLAALVATAPALAVIEGEAGIGKSRLVAEALGDSAAAGLRVLGGACVQIREPFPLGPIVEALRGRAPDLAGRTCRRSPETCASCCPSWPPCCRRRRRRWTTGRPSGTGSSAGSSRCWPRSARPSWSSRTCTGPTGRRSSS
ncbi:AAA family ATPase [Nonomuraea antimicrobica]